jgi:hypothetical protein
MTGLKLHRFDRFPKDDLFAPGPDTITALANLTLS